MTQEDINDLLKNDWWYSVHKNNEKQCPQCGYTYSGDGVQLCVECQYEKERDK